MRKLIAVILILLGIAATTMSIREYGGKKKNIELAGFELSLTKSESKKIFYRNTGIGLVMLVGGVALLRGRKRNR